ncbi:MAG: D-aminoacylase [Acidobacteriia bacterium]|jgi:N-acyl-D-aspartate/D-glutamate deacylase|nr:D-aminoacylase [Terriglobia bacterium]
MKHAFLWIAFVLLVAQPGGRVQLEDPFDVLITGGRIVDGSGAPWYRADVGIRDGRIAAIGKLAGQPARKTISAEGMVVAPGFVDMMGGSSYPLLVDPASAQSKLRQGITTMLVGEGGSPAPQSPATAAEDSAGGLRITWQTYAEYFRLLEQKGVGLNVVHNVGAAQVRRIVVGEADRKPTPAELDRMKELVAEAMRDGAVGLSTALIYPPGAYATTEEIIELARTAAEYAGVYFTHMRNESGALLEAIEETIRIGREASIPVHIYHLKAAGQQNWPLMAQAIGRIAEARRQGVDVTADIYPYIRNGIGLRSFIHPRHYAQGDAAFLPRLTDPDLRHRLRQEIENDASWENWYVHVGRDWNNVLISAVGEGVRRDLQGLSMQQAAERLGVDPWTAFFDLVRQGPVFVAPRSMNEEQKHLALRAPFVAICTDAAPIHAEAAGKALGQSFHPRAFGAFARVLAKYVREDRVISLEEAIQKMTSLPANRLRLYDRGRLSPGLRADVVVFDPERVQDTATFTKPLSYSEGFVYVLVNGQPVIEQNRWTGVLPGTVIRHRR